MNIIHKVSTYEGKTPEEVVQKKDHALQQTFFILAKPAVLIEILVSGHFLETNRIETQLSSQLSSVNCVCSDCNVPWQQEKINQSQSRDFREVEGCSSFIVEKVYLDVIWCVGIRKHGTKTWMY